MEDNKISEEEAYIAMIEAQMNKGVGRLKIFASEELQEGEVQNIHHHGRCDIGSPWAKGTVSNCDAIDV